MYNKKLQGKGENPSEAITKINDPSPNSGMLPLISFLRNKNPLGLDNKTPFDRLSKYYR